VVITLDRERFLPIALEYHSGRNGREILHYRFLELTIDRALADDVFEPQRPEGWKIKRRGND
jgi:outer membrane lipoprotein-sorting protein